MPIQVSTLYLPFVPCLFSTQKCLTKLSFCRHKAWIIYFPLGSERVKYFPLGSVVQLHEISLNSYHSISFNFHYILEPNKLYIRAQQIALNGKSQLIPQHEFPCQLNWEETKPKEWLLKLYGSIALHSRCIWENLFTEFSFCFPVTPQYKQKCKSHTEYRKSSWHSWLKKINKITFLLWNGKDKLQTVLDFCWKQKKKKKQATKASPWPVTCCCNVGMDAFRMLK